MAYFDKIADSAFKEGPNGEVIFYANGVLSKGRVVPNEETRTKLHRFQKLTNKLALFLGLPYGFLLILSGIFTIISLTPAILLTVYIVFKQHSLTQGLEKHSLKLGFGEALKKSSHALPTWYHWFLGTTSILLIVFGLIFPYLLKMPFSNFIYSVIGIVSLGVLGLCTSIKLYRLKNLTRC